MITKKLAKYFDGGVCSRGHAYYNRGKVNLLDTGSDGTASAAVQGETLYDVDIDLIRKGGTWSIGADCTCPYASDHAAACKHVWATLLALEADGFFTQFGAPTARIEFSSLVDDLTDLDGLGFGGAAAKLTQSLAATPGASAGALDVLYRAFPHLKKTVQTLMPAPKPVAQRPPAPPPDDFAWLKRLAGAHAQPYAPAPPPPLPPEPVDPIYVLEAHEADRKGEFVLSLAKQNVTAAGKLGRIKKLSLTPADIPRIREASDRHIGLMLIGAGRQHDGYGYYGHSYYNAPSRWTIPAEVQPALLPLLFASGRFHARLDREDDPLPLTWDDGEPWELVLGIDPAAKPGGYVIVPQLRRGTEKRPISPADVCFDGSPGLVLRDELMARMQPHGCFSWIDDARLIGPRPIRKDALPKLIQTLAGMNRFPPVVWPPEWNVREVTDLMPQPELTLEIEENGDPWASRYAGGRVAFLYDEVAADGNTGGAILVDAKGGRLIRRQTGAEGKFIQRLQSLGVKRRNYSTEWEIPQKKLPAIVSTLLAEDWRVLGNKKLYHRPGEFSIDVSSGIDWFDVKGGVEFDGQFVAFPALLEALRKNERFVRLDDGSLGMLPEKWLNQHRRWLEMGEAKDGHVRFTKTQIGLIDALLAEMPQATFDENLAAARKRLQGFAGIAPRMEPGGFVGELRDYQREGLGWLNFLDEFEWGGCLADDMGLGKTVQLLALLAERKRAGDKRPSLVIAPKSVVFNWVREADRFAPELRVLDYTGLERKSRSDGLDGHDLVLTTYGTLRRDIEALRKRDFNYVVLDEAQAIKNPSSQSAKATRLLKARRRLVMTGTPVENHLGDLWSLFEFLNPGMLGPQAAFRSLAGGSKSGEADPATLRMVQRMLRPFVLRRTKEQVAKELPSRMEQTLPCEMGKQQTAYYNELRDHYRASVLAKVDKQGLGKSQMHVLEALLRLRQAACHPGLIDASKREAESAKLEALLPMLEELIEGGHKALVFSQFTSLLAIVREALGKQGITYEYLDGQTRHRDKCVDRFQTDPQCPLFLISLKAGGVGLNLTAADYVFILDPWWNPAVEAQAIDRTHRIGQDKKVIAYRLIAQNTVEDKILQLQKSKRDLAEAIITEDNSLIRKLTRDDLAVLLS